MARTGRFGYPSGHASAEESSCGRAGSSLRTQGRPGARRKARPSRTSRNRDPPRARALAQTDEAPLTPVELLLALPSEVGGGHDATVICRGRVVRTEPANRLDPRPAVAATIAGYRLAHVQGNDPRRI